MLETVEQALALAAATRYPPLGSRSWGPIQPLPPSTPARAFRESSNAAIVVFGQIETEAGLNNLDELLRVDGIDGVYVGPWDLAISMGWACPGEADDLDIMDALRFIASKVRRAGKFAGVHCADAAMVQQAARYGYQMCSVASDWEFMLQAAREAAQAARKARVGAVAGEKQSEAPKRVEQVRVIAQPPVVDMKRVDMQTRPTMPIPPLPSSSQHGISLDDPLDEEEEGKEKPQAKRPPSPQVWKEECAAWADALDAFESWPERRQADPNSFQRPPPGFPPM